MIKRTLYTGNGVSLSPVFSEGQTESKYVRLIAEDGKAITNGAIVAACVDVLASDVDRWMDCEPPTEEPIEEEMSETEEKAKAYDILTGVAE